MKQYTLPLLDAAELQALCKRPAINLSSIVPTVQPILDDVQQNGDKAVRAYETRFGGQVLDDLQVTEQEITEACTRIPEKVKRAFEQAAKNIQTFHGAQLKGRSTVETMTGVTCFAEMRGIENVGLYVPGGTAPLPSTLLMLAIPAKLAGCQKIVVCTPSQNGIVTDIVLYAASLCGVDKIFKIGGAQAIAAMAYGTESVPKMDKIFGPGNQYVTAAKMLVSIDPDGAAIDMPAGPSEVLVVADKQARADFVAADLLSQAEHGPDSQVVLVCTDDQKTQEILREVDAQLATLPRKEIAAQALQNSFALVVGSINEAINFSNMFAPEHLILNIKNAARIVGKINNAGSVFLGAYSCESAGDYASGTNHSLPTYGYARTFGGVSVGSFQKQITFQEVTREGAKNIGPIVATMAAEESLEAHKRAMEIRFMET
jgi:histidinol dehydrogenase